MAIVGYARVSTTGQSIDQQLRTLEGCDKVFQEKISGSRTDRPQLEALLDYVRAGDILKVTKLDRLARNTRHLLELVELLDRKGVALQVVNLGIDTSTPTGKLMLTMIGAIATFEREIMLERQAEGIVLAKQRGVYKGRKPTAQAKKAELMELLSQGVPKRQAAAELGISESSLYRMLSGQR
ncbi:recombinase family protein [Ferrimonas sp. YFM]|uniref:recombinase family protein n=1 Tax=Ferrimonas sp. YFM TaxID=3028878 RepID=UPI002573E2A1|nr:recombinase family protein [Ferrimonas sp. YFM]BDY04696.1 integrase [Ferrimonas sp. YFM]